MPVTDAEPDVRRLERRYLSPSWLYVLDDLYPLALWAVRILFYGAWLWCFYRLDRLPETLFLLALGVGLANIVAHTLAGPLLRRWGLSALRPHGDRLLAEFRPGLFRIHIGDAWRAFDATAPHGFLMREHPLRIDEARAEERARTLGYGQQSDHFRRGYEIVLDMGPHRIPLADVAFEEEARTLVRLLQEHDAHARGTEGTRQLGAAGAAPLGSRPSLD
ncbi:hypothetical protein [Oceanibaculum pacificum]|uniref:hypothetical protein n=1 Tax=Oceanibaculum pacificum TaxID=580166 RepID=UPI0012EE721B|nr:hypothetical protein [Oceanibaculum pacificum]